MQLALWVCIRRLGCTRHIVVILSHQQGRDLTPILLNPQGKSGHDCIFHYTSPQDAGPSKGQVGV